MFDMTVTLGNLLTIVAMAIAGLGFVWTMKGELRAFEGELHAISGRLAGVEGVMSKVTDALVQLAAQGARLDAHADRISRLERSEG